LSHARKTTIDDDRRRWLSLSSWRVLREPVRQFVTGWAGKVAAEKGIDTDVKGHVR
jgi:hypothetical protein